MTNYIVLTESQTVEEFDIYDDGNVLTVINDQPVCRVYTIAQIMQEDEF